MQLNPTPVTPLPQLLPHHLQFLPLPKPGVQSGPREESTARTARPAPPAAHPIKAGSFSAHPAASSGIRGGLWEGGGKRYQGVEKERPFLPPLPPQKSLPSTATQPAPARNTVQRLAKALRLIDNWWLSSSSPCRVTASSHASDVTSWRRETRPGD